MLPAIFLSSLATLGSLGLDTVVWSSYIVSGLNAIISFLLAVVSYMKLDAQSEAHKISAHQYDKLQSSCEFTSGYFLFFVSLISFSFTSTMGLLSISTPNVSFIKFCAALIIC